MFNAKSLRCKIQLQVQTFKYWLISEASVRTIKLVLVMLTLLFVCFLKLWAWQFFVITVTGSIKCLKHIDVCSRCVPDVTKHMQNTYIPPPSIILTPSERFTNQPASSHLMKKQHMEFHYPLEFSPHANSLGEKVRLLDNWKPQCRHSVTRCRPGWVAMDGKCTRAVCAFAIYTCMCKYIHLYWFHAGEQSIQFYTLCTSIRFVFLCLTVSLCLLPSPCDRANVRCWMCTCVHQRV